MELSSINQYFGNLDLFLLDQILKKRFHLGMKVLDAGCGEGRNLMYFLKAGFTVYGIDQDRTAVEALRFIAASIRPDLSRDHFQVAGVDKLPYMDQSFDLIISCGVLHYANDQQHFFSMLQELVRCIKPGGILFVSMASNLGMEHKIAVLKSGRSRLPDGTEFFLLTRSLLDALKERYAPDFLEPMKTVNIDDQRCLTTLVLSIPC